jgi:hypothetical protein
LIRGLSKLDGAVSARAEPQARIPEKDKARHSCAKGFLVVLKVLTVNIEAYP